MANVCNITQLLVDSQTNDQLSILVKPYDLVDENVF